MAQATFSCPFGAIHLEDRRGTPQRRTSFANEGFAPVDPDIDGTETKTDMHNTARVSCAHRQTRIGIARHRHPK